MKDKKVNSSKTPKTYKYYYSKASIIRSALIAILCFAIFVVFFVCFMVYGGKDRNPNAVYGYISKTEKMPPSIIDAVAADGNGRVYTFYSRTFEINAYDENGNFLESYQIPAGNSSGDVASLFDGGIVCKDGKLYAFNDVGNVYVYKDGKSSSKLDTLKNAEECKSIYELYENSKNKAEGKDGKTFKNNFVSVVDENGKIIVNNFPKGVFFSPLSMVMAIIMTFITYLAIRRYNKKVRNEKIKTLFKKNIIVK